MIPSAMEKLLVGRSEKFDLDGDRSSAVIASAIVCIIISTSCVALRLWSRWMARAGYWWDDFFIVVALIMSWGPNIALIDSAQHGLGKHILGLARTQGLFPPLRRVLQNTYAFVILYVIAIIFAKLAIIYFLYRIFPIKHFRYFLVGCQGFVATLGISSVIVAICPCLPIHDFWDTLAGKLGGHCIRTVPFWIASSSLNAASSFALLALPIPLLWRLRTSNLQKTVLTFIFVLGLACCAVGLAHAAILSRLNEDDLTWNLVDAAILTSAEPSAVISAACLPSFRPLIASLIWGRSTRPHAISRPSQGSFSRSWVSQSQDEEAQSGKGFNRLRDSDMTMYGMQKHSTHVSGGTAEEDSAEHDMGNGPRLSQYHAPKQGIRVKTTITVTERVDFRSDLF